MKNITIPTSQLITAISFFVFHGVQAQEISRQSLGAGGGSYTFQTESHSAIVQQSIGQASSIGIFQDQRSELRQGFIQPNTLLNIQLDQKEIEVSVYPNPFRDGIRIEFQTTINEMIFIQVHDLLGRLIMSKEIQSSEEQFLDLGHLTRGSYLLSIGSKEFKQNSLQIQKL